MPGGVRKAKQELGNAIKSHKDRIDEAIETGDMDNVRSANEIGFKEEVKEVEEYSRMK